MPLGGGAPGTRASRRCDRAGRWEPGDYSHCLYTNDITRVLYTFVLVRRGWGTPPALLRGHREGRSQPNGQGEPYLQAAGLCLLFLPVQSQEPAPLLQPPSAIQTH